jgi:2-oxo-4-hydroxy-4-carboxy-5-ureidoimidazoline decarboxylase
MTGPAVSLSDLDTMDRARFVALLGGVFEKAPWIAERAFAKRPFATVADLWTAMQDAVASAGEATQLDLIRGHPDLAGKVAQAGALSAESRLEQGSLGLDRLSEAEFARFERLNAAYRDRFGFPFVICVRRHTRYALLDRFERRLASTPAEERGAALEEIAHIARLRLVGLVDGPGKPRTDGRLSTYVLDTVSGKPAAGVKVVLSEIGASAEGRLQEAVTNADGRTDAPLLAGAPCASAPTSSPSISVPTSPRRASPPPTRPSSTWYPCASPSPSPRAATTCRFSSRPGATPPTAAAECRLLQELT